MKINLYNKTTDEIETATMERSELEGSTESWIVEMKIGGMCYVVEVYKPIVQ